jgi:FKBP-type peptidyl-prolyl cis-trans isomerase FkpA
MIYNRARYLCLLIAPLLLGVANAQSESETDEMFYFLGTALGKNLTQLSLSDKEFEFVVSGMQDHIHGKARKLDEATYTAMLNTVAQERMLAGAATETVGAEAYVEEMAAESGAIKTESGLVYLEMEAGNGGSPSADSVITAHYHGTLRDGTVFDSSVRRGQPFTSSLGGVIPCWTEAIQLMKEGGKSKITCPAALAYGSRGSGAVPGGAALTFEVELIEIAE